MTPQEKIASYGFAGIAAYQQFYGLEQTGVLDLPTLRSLEYPRFCGRPDVENLGEGLPHWGKNLLTFAYTNLLPGFTKEDMIRAGQVAWDRWAAVCNIKASYIKSTSDTVIDVLISCGRIDGPSSTLAWCELPGNGTTHQLKLKLDDAEAWVIAENAATMRINLIAVLGHEIGHALGLVHLMHGNWMAGSYNPLVAEPQPGDVAEALRRYGQPKGTAPPTIPTPGEDDWATIRVPKSWVKFL